MIFKIFSVEDIKAENFMPPFFQANEAMAKRTFSDACAEEDHPFGKNPGDYFLCDLGTYDDMTGFINANKKPKRILGAAEVAVMLDALHNLDARQQPYVEHNMKDHFDG